VTQKITAYWRHLTKTQKIKNVVAISLSLFFYWVLVLELAGFLVIAVVGSPSMANLAPPGSLVVFARSPEYHVGDVIMFKVKDFWVMHRIVEETPEGFHTKGDMNSFVDPWVVPPSAVQGKLILVIPLIGNFLILLRLPLVIASILTLLVAEFVWKPIYEFKSFLRA